MIRLWLRLLPALAFVMLGLLTPASRAADLAPLLDKPIVLELRNNTFQQGLDRIAGALSLRLKVDWDSLAPLGVTPDARLDFTFQQVPARRILELLLRHQSARTDSIAISIAQLPAGPALLLGSRQALAADYPPIQFDVRDLLAAQALVFGSSDDEADRMLPLALAKVVGQPGEWNVTGGRASTIEVEEHTRLNIRTDVLNQRAMARLLAAMNAALRRQPLPPPPLSPTAGKTTKALLKTMALKPDTNTLGPALEQVRLVAQVPLFPDWHGLARIKVTPTSPITLPSGPMPAEKLLTHLLSPFQGKITPQWAIDADGVVIIAAANDPLMGVSLACYDLRPLLKGANSARTQRIADIMKQVQAVEPASWIERGGPHGALSQYAGILVVRTAPHLQPRIAQVVGDLKP